MDNYERRLLAAAELILSADRRRISPVSPMVTGVTAELKTHQVEGLSWLVSRYELGVNVILGDEMGLGKTLQAISLLSYLKTNSISPGPFLILCPLSVTDGWLSEFTKFCPSLKVTSYIGDKAHRLSLRKIMHHHIQTYHELPFDVLLTTYDIVLTDQNFLSQIPWCYSVIDEAQRLKNSSSVLYNILEKKYIMPRRLLLTGTPIQNNLTELWALMHFSMPSVFGTIDEFTSTFKEASISNTGVESEKVKRKFKTLKYILGAFMLRRTKAMLVETGALSLPPLTEITLLVPLVPLQKKLYVSVLRRELQTLLSFSRGSSNHQSLQNIVIQLRKACSHPYLFNGIEPEPYQEGEHLIQASGKLIVLDQLLKKLNESRHRVLLFAQMTHTLDILQDFLEVRKYTYERLDGSVRAEERFSAIRSFSSRSNQGQNGPFVFMISTRAGGVGLNLIGADTVIFYEQDWNPQVDKQALQRAHRIGQLNHVLSINLVTERTIDEVIMRRAERKLKLSQSVMAEETVNNNNNTVFTKSDESVETMRSLIFGLHILDPINSNSNSDSDTLDEESINNLNKMTDRVVRLRNNDPSDKTDRNFEVNQTDIRNINSSDDSINVDPGLDESAYRSWVEKFKQASSSTDETLNLEVGRKSRDNDRTGEEREVRREEERKRREENKLAKWEAAGYESLSVNEPETESNTQGFRVLSENEGVHFVYGDCTDPWKICPSEPAIIFACVDNSGTWGKGGMFKALDRLSTNISEKYEIAHQFNDLHMADLHLIQLDEAECNRKLDASLWVALAVVQSYNTRRKVPRSSISVPDLELSLTKASFSAAKYSASLHMPRIGYQDGSQRSEWYAIERLLRKYALLHGITIYVYYYRRESRGNEKSSEN